LIGSQLAAQLQASTTVSLASIQASIEGDRNQTALAMAGIQSDAEARAAAAAAKSTALQTNAQVSAAQMQAHSQESSQTLNFLGGVINTVGQVITTIAQNKRNSGGGATNYPKPSFALPSGGKLIGFPSNDVRTHG
jgi:hypothetical protein